MANVLALIDRHGYGNSRANELYLACPPVEITAQWREELKPAAVLRAKSELLSLAHATTGRHLSDKRYMMVRVDESIIHDGGKHGAMWADSKLIGPQFQIEF